TSFLFPSRVATRYNTGDQSWNWGNHQYRGTNAAYGAIVTYWLKQKAANDSLVKVEILQDGKIIRTLKKPSTDGGFNRATWDLRIDAPKVLSDMMADTSESNDGRGRPVGPQVLPGTYAVRLTVGGETQEQPLTVRIDPTSTISATELRLQYDQAMRLNQLIASLIDTERNMMAFKGQVQERRATGQEMRGEAAADLVKAATEESGKLDSVRLQLTRPRTDKIPYYSEGPRPLERAMSLMGAIDNGLTPVIGGQQEYMGSVRRDVQTVMDMVEKQITSTVQRINPLLDRLDLPKLVPPPKKTVAM
ncbi:MAG: hypothetical protein ABIT38_22050, partial [Gemmatimonadaceae bacterium]